MDKELIAYQAWAPAEALWSPWVKPVLFAPARPGLEITYDPPPDDSLANPPAESGEEPSLDDWLPPPNRHTALIIDLPGARGVEAGLAVARRGYRPAPLYNGVRPPELCATVVPVEKIAAALFGGAEELSRLRLPRAAPPAFLLDADRMLSAKGAQGLFDNRWCVFPQDLPSAAFLLGEGLERVLLWSGSIQSDLAHVLYRYQQGGLKIGQFDSRTLRAVEVAKPSQFGDLMYRFKVLLGLKRHPGGGFGGMIPFFTEGSGAHGIG